MGKGFYAVSIVFVLISCVYGCSDLGPGARATGKADDEYDTDDRKIYYSKVVVFGEVVGNATTGNYPFKGVAGVYTIKFNVLCTYKGGPLPSTIYIAGIGNMKGELPGCPVAPVGNSKHAIMFLKPTERPEVFEVEFKPNVGAVDIILDDLSINCGLELDEDYDEVCSEFEVIEKDCVKWTPIVVDTEDEDTTPKVNNVTPQTTKKAETTKKVIDIDVKPEPEDKNNNQSDQSYETKPEGNSNTDGKAGQVSGTKTGGNGASTVSVATLLLTIVPVLLAVLV